MTEKIGPVQLVAVGFTPDAEFEGRIMDELERLERHKTIRILDLLFIGKDAETGDLLALDYQGEELGAIVGSLLGFEFEEDGERPDGSSNGIQAHAFGLSQVEMQEMAASLHPGSSAGFLLIEHVWARDLKRAIRDASGFPLGEGFLTPEAVADVATELLAGHPQRGGVPGQEEADPWDLNGELATDTSTPGRSAVRCCRDLPACGRGTMPFKPLTAEQTKPYSALLGVIQ